MLRKLMIVSVAIFCLLLFGCNEAPAPEAETESKFVENEEAIRAFATNWEDIKIDDSSGVIDVTIRKTQQGLSQQTFQYIGEVIYNTKLYCDEAFGEYKVSYWLTDLSTKSTIQWSAENGKWGSIMDTRSGKAVITRLDTVDDLVTFFPTLQGIVKEVS